MTIIDNILTAISVPAESTNLGSEILKLNAITSAIGLVIITFIFIRVCYQWYTNAEIREQLGPVLIISLALLLRVAVNLLDKVIDLYFDTTRELVLINVWQTIPWILVYVGLVPLFKNLIKVPKRREYQIKRIIRIIYFTVVVLLILTALGFVPTTDAVGGAIASLGLLVVTVVLWILVIRIWRESGQNASKLVVIRLQMAALGNLMIAVSFTSTPFVIVLAVAGLYTPVAAYLNNLFTVLLTVIAQYFFYGTFFTPTWMKKRQGLITDQESMI